MLIGLLPIVLWVAYFSGLLNVGASVPEISTAIIENFLNEKDPFFGSSELGNFLTATLMLLQNLTFI